MKRFGDKSLENIVRTDERYGHDGLFQGPRGWVYYEQLENPRPEVQNPNLWPDCQSTYFPFQFELPPGCSLTAFFEFPRVRYFQFALNIIEEKTFVATGEALSGAQLEPDKGSINPFRVGAYRQVTKRDFTLHVVAEDAPQDADKRKPNTLYAGKDGGMLLGVWRSYLSDKDYDGPGLGPENRPLSGPAFRYEGKLADGTHLTAEEVARQFARPFKSAIKPPLTADQWVAIVNSRDNDPALKHESAPARIDSKWEKYRNFMYSIIGSFKTPEERAKLEYDTPVDGGGDPTTQYFFLHLSRKFGPVFIMRGKMPTFPDTFTRELEITPDTQMQYWSLVPCESAPSGHITDGLCDMQIPLDKDRNYTIVVSRPEDRPANATDENGVAWLEWPARGEGLDHPQNRLDFNMLQMRMIGVNPKWKESPENVTAPGTEEEVMGPYFPKGEYTDKAGFEALGKNISNA